LALEGTAGASIVSFNLDAFNSYEHEQGANAPISEAAAFKYTTVLNRFLERDSGHRIQVGDTSTVFWAECTDAEAAAEAEDMFACLFGADDKTDAVKNGTADKDKTERTRFENFSPNFVPGGRSMISILCYPKASGSSFLGLLPTLPEYRCDSISRMILASSPNVTSIMLDGCGLSRRPGKSSLQCSVC